MPQKRVSALAGAINAARLVVGGDENITGITNDSRQVRPGWLYAALPGVHTDGHRFIDDAIAAGASAILCTRAPERVPNGVAVLVSPAPRFVLSQMSHSFFDAPSERLEVVGVTGTDGKTSTVYFLHQLIRAGGESCGFVSTAGTCVGDTERDNLLHQSTPEAPVIHSTLNDMAEAGNRVGVLESTSHGLSAQTCRLAHVHYRAAVVTNLTHEHLEFHGTYERYRHDKANLFRALDRGAVGDNAGFLNELDPAFVPPGDSGVAASNGGSGPHRPRVLDWKDGAESVTKSGARFGVINLDCPEAAYFAAATTQPLFGYRTSPGPATLRADDIVPEATGTRFSIVNEGRRRFARLPFPGVFNVENALASILAAGLLTDRDPLDFAESLERLRAVRGRMSVMLSEPFAVIVDYAHTPGAFRRTLPFFREHTAGRLITVFGSGGERDVEKRPLQGKIAGEHADIIVLTDEDPRGESREAILDQIAAGCPDRRDGEDLYRIPDRRTAVRHALKLAQPGDTVLLLGKGHETSIIGPDGPDPWDEEQVALEELRALGPG